MNFDQLQERLRAEVKRRMERGLLSGKQLASQTELKAPHISNFVNKKSKLSLNALDRMLNALSLTIEDLVPALSFNLGRGETLEEDHYDRVPLVSPAIAIYSPNVPRSAVLRVVQISPGALQKLTPRSAPGRTKWQRFVAVQIDTEQAEPMSPKLQPHSIVVLDRHDNLLSSRRKSPPDIFAVNLSSVLIFRYASFAAPHIILRPWGLNYPVELLDVEGDASPGSLIVGRACLCISQL